MKLGVYFIDLFANTLLVFMVLTILAFSSVTESPERTLPPVSLARAEAGSTGTTRVTPVTISARPGGPDGARFFVGDDEVSLDELDTRLRAATPVAVMLRVDEALSTRIAIRLMALLNSVGVRSVTFAFKAPGRER